MKIAVRYRNLAVRHKLRLIIMLTVGVALVLACAAIVAYDLMVARRDMQNDLAALAEIVGSNSTAAVTFGDQRAAEELLSGLKAKQHIVAATIYSDSGKPFAAYRRPGAAGRFAPPRFEGSWFDGDRLVVYRSILLNQQKAGIIYLESDLGELHTRVRNFVWIVLAILLSNCALAMGLA